MNCRFCNTPLSFEFLDLVNSPPSNSFLSIDQLNEPEIFYPLRVLVCDNCFLVQIDEYQKSSAIFNNDYVYFSSFSTSWLNHAKKYCEEVVKRLSLNQNSKVIEVASNDGYLLQFFLEKNIPVLGIEPTANTAKIASDKGIETITQFFGTALADELASKGILADLLIGNNVLAHVPDINDFVAGMKRVLTPTGTITMEFPHLIQMINQNQFDTIYHEHFSYLSLFTVKKIFFQQGLEIYDVDEISTHGGSLRIYAKHLDDTSKQVSTSVSDLVSKEKLLGVDTLTYYKDFNTNVDQIKIDFLSFLIEQKKNGKKVVGYGAAAKGNTLLNYCGVKKDLISFVVDANPNKQGKYLPGSHIPVVSEDLLKQFQPNFVVIFPWNLSAEIMNQLSYIRTWGGRFLIPIPNVHID
ncbi:MAG: class I SAM-dependent methyltransferase [Sediminibacterium sp.]|nr:class I SAM-dependent methyltransferase [Sediminibacterium sp.]